MAQTSHDPGNKLGLGRHVFGFAGILFGLITLCWRGFNGWQQIDPLGNVGHPEVLVFLFGGIEIAGGVAVLFRKTAPAGAVALGELYLVFALLWIPKIAHQPLNYDPWGNLFEQLSQVAGAMILYAMGSRGNAERAARIARLGRIVFGVCVLSFTLEQVFFLSGTAAFVPRWIPPGQMFWAVTTTLAFALAAIALLSGHLAPLAARLTTAMILGFGVLVWLPLLATDAHQLFNWAGNAENLSIAGAAWVVGDFLGGQRDSAAVGTGSPDRVAVRA